MIRKIVNRDGKIARYDRGRIATALLKAFAACGKPNSKRVADAMATKVEEALFRTYRNGAIPSVEDIQDVVENVLMMTGHTDIARSYIIYRHRRAMMRAARAYSFEITDNVPYKKIYEILVWNMEHRCSSVPELNRIIRNGDYPELVKSADQRYSEEVAQAAGGILERLGDVRIVIVAGPSSSGKTTTMIKVSEELKKAGVGFRAVNIDNYFFDLQKHPVDEFGDRDYETPVALDLELINSHLVQLLDGQAIKTPHYNFKTGVSTPDVHSMRINKNEIILIDSLHGLYHEMTASIQAAQKFRLYIETLGQVRGEDGSFMRWADNRLLRRMIRDKSHRALRPLQTLTHWHYVRRSELEHIIPFIKDADFIVNSALPYELPLLRSRLFRYIRSSIDRFKGDPKRLDAHIRANRVYAFLKPLKSVRDDGCVPSTSLIREFTGGSIYAY